jgi:hypothetical protein
MRSIAYHFWFVGLLLVVLQSIRNLVKAKTANTSVGMGQQKHQVEAKLQRKSAINFNSQNLIKSLGDLVLAS